jgi:hypothetical protein
MVNPDRLEQRCGTCIDSKPLPAEQIEEMFVFNLSGSIPTLECKKHIGLLVHGTDLPITLRQPGSRNLLESCHSSLRLTTAINL